MSTELPKRIHITGGPGSGKSWLAKRLAAAFGVEVIDLDGRGLALHVYDFKDPAAGAMDAPIEDDTSEALIIARDLDLDAATAVETWVCDGSFAGVSRIAFGRADLVVWMDAPWSVASYRIVARHVKAELRRSNRFPGWRRLYDFWRWSARFYADRNPHGLNDWGTPNTRAFTREVLAPYESKLVVVRSKREVRELLRTFAARDPALSP